MPTVQKYSDSMEVGTLRWWNNSLFPPYSWFSVFPSFAFSALSYHGKTRTSISLSLSPFSTITEITYKKWFWETVLNTKTVCWEQWGHQWQKQTSRQSSSSQGVYNAIGLTVSLHGGEGKRANTMDAERRRQGGKWWK
jgi:hypothetical protein